jgi:hypothetical protein
MTDDLLTRVFVPAEADRERTACIDHITRSGIYIATCDWGDCEGETVGYRRDSHGSGTTRDWLCVCQRHYDEAPVGERILLATGEVRP